MHRTKSMGVPASVVNFHTERFQVQIFAQPIPVHRQHAYRHLIAESRLLQLAGEEARAVLRRSREQGLKTEPAFAHYFRLEGDPYERLYELADATEEELLAVVAAARSGP